MKKWVVIVKAKGSKLEPTKHVFTSLEDVINLLRLLQFNTDKYDEQYIIDEITE